MEMVKTIDIELLEKTLCSPKTASSFLDQTRTEIDHIYRLSKSQIRGLFATSTLLQTASAKNDSEMVKWLLAKGADPNIFNEDQYDENSIPPVPDYKNLIIFFISSICA